MTKTTKTTTTMVVEYILLAIKAKDTHIAITEEMKGKKESQSIAALRQTKGQSDI